MSEKSMLMITDTFPPAFAPRPGYLCKWFTRNAHWEVVVVHPPIGEEGLYPKAFGHLSGYATREFVFYPDDRIHSHSISKLLRQWRKRELRTREVLECVWGKVCYHLLHRTMNCSGKRMITEAMKARRFDVILCCTTANGLHRLGDWASRRYSIPVIQDLRDIEEQNCMVHPWWKWRERANRRLRNEVLLRADAVVTTTPQMGEDIRRQAPDLKYQVIYNGYDPDVFGAVEPVRTEKFNIIYIGTARPKFMRSFFSALERFLSKADRSKVCVKFYTTQTSYAAFVEPHLPNSLGDVVRRCDSVSQEKLSAVFSEASVLLILSSGQHTVVTKTFEYLSSMRPILEYSDFEDNDQCEILKGAKNGTVVTTEAEICSYLEGLYSEWQRNGFVRGERDDAYVSRFSRANEAQQYLDLITAIVKDRA